VTAARGCLTDGAVGGRPVLDRLAEDRNRAADPVIRLVAEHEIVLDPDEGRQDIRA
jgi:hypothetical protein